MIHHISKFCFLQQFRSVYFALCIISLLSSFLVLCYIHKKMCSRDFMCSRFFFSVSSSRINVICEKQPYLRMASIAYKCYYYGCTKMPLLFKKHFLGLRITGCNKPKSFKFPLRCIGCISEWS
ncbi:hypothetical protein BDA99DRAFT_577209 [Phascolomyces articulosus]|uniref:Uncharacterized protein n=1 Tax=Phascolomyces articulosus TaxID=60185 RepID=A0AAD5JL14_9FUNG|nr:hypothetical protein BDA99DRAFT_577209 [Phascolomyces articulosus]